MRAVAEDGTAEAALSRAIDRLARDLDLHLLSGPVEEDELARLEQALAVTLPPSFRTYLSRLGSGLLYDAHEIFGPRSLQLHDIEFVPSLASVVRQLRGTLGPNLLPFHRGDGTVHVFDLTGGPHEPLPVRALAGGGSYRDLAGFLEAVVVAPRRR